MRGVFSAAKDAKNAAFSRVHFPVCGGGGKKTLIKQEVSPSKVDRGLYVELAGEGSEVVTQKWRCKEKTIAFVSLLLEPSSGQ